MCASCSWSVNILCALPLTVTQAVLPAWAASHLPLDKHPMCFHADTPSPLCPVPVTWDGQLEVRAAVKPAPL